MHASHRGQVAVPSQRGRRAQANGDGAEPEKPKEAEEVPFEPGVAFTGESEAAAGRSVGSRVAAGRVVEVPGPLPPVHRCGFRPRDPPEAGGGASLQPAEGAGGASATDRGRRRWGVAADRRPSHGHHRWSADGVRGRRMKLDCEEDPHGCFWLRRAGASKDAAPRHSP